MGEFAIGQGVKRTEDPRLLRGGGRYVDDMTLPNTAYGSVLRAAHAHARIKSIDTSAALKSPGVIAVLTDEDWRAQGWAFRLALLGAVAFVAALAAGLHRGGLLGGAWAVSAVMVFMGPQHVEALGIPVTLRRDPVAGSTA